MENGILRARFSHSQESRKANAPAPNKTSGPYTFHIAFPTRPRVNGAFIKNSYAGEFVRRSRRSKGDWSRDREHNKIGT